jgi:succinyl-CoA synthetase beta subunit
MNFEEHAAKTLVLAPAGIAIPEGRLCASPEQAAAAVAAIGAAVIKAQVPAGKRGKAGGIRRVATPEEGARAARDILGMRIGGHHVARLLVEAQAAIARELYAAVLPDVAARCPMVLFSAEGGMEIEELAVSRREALRRHPVDIRRGFSREDAAAMLNGLDLGAALPGVANALAQLYAAWRSAHAELLEINPLAVLTDGRVMALDGKLVLDDAALHRHPELAAHGSPDPQTALEARGAREGLKFIELAGEVGILANGAGLTMTTMDVVRHCGGQPANFLEIGGEAYTKAKTALGLVLAHPRIRSLVVNFCGAFARTDVMAEGVVAAWEELRPTIPVFFSIHGTGEDEAVALVRARLGIEPFERMEDAVRAAVEAAR